MALNGKYLADADRLLNEGDLVQASEKYWGAVATMIKMVAAQRNWRHSGHAELRTVVRSVSQETQDTEYLALLRSAERLHANFYEGFLDQSSLHILAEHAVRLIEKLQLRFEEVRVT